jgi:hypothetical protein
MSVRNGIVLLLALSTLSLLIGCGNNNNIAPIPPPSGSFSNSNLKGTYVFSVSGTDVGTENGTVAGYGIVGAITADGGGKITGGTIDIVDGQLTPAYNLSINNGGFYSVSVDGRGQVTIGTSTTNPFGGNLTFDFVLANSFQGLIIGFDGNGSGSGTLDLQTAGLTQASLAGPYAFSLSGVDTNEDPFATVGAFTLDQNGNILSGTGVEDFNDNGLIPSSNQTLSGQVILGPSPTPTTVLNAGSYSLTYDVYAIDATHLKFIEAGPTPVLVGDAFSQPSATIATGPLAFTLAGSVEGNPSALGGFMVTDGAGNITAASTEDVNIAGTTGSVSSFSANYISSGPGRFELDNFANFTPSNTVYAAYPSSGGLLMMEIDSLGIMTGAAYPQSNTAFGTDSEGYGLNLTGINTLAVQEGGGLEEVDDIAEFTAAATGSCDSLGDTLCGIIDENFAPGGFPTAGMALGGSFGAVDATGRYGLSAAAGNSNITTLNGGFNLIFYAVDGNSFPFMEEDQGQIATGVFLLQNPTAAGPATAHSHMFIARPLINPKAARAKKK